MNTFSGEIPLNAAIRIYGDSGAPEKVFTDTEGYVSEAVSKVVANVAGQISIKSSLNVLEPTLTVE